MISIGVAEDEKSTILSKLKDFFENDKSITVCPISENKRNYDIVVWCTDKSYDCADIKSDILVLNNESAESASMKCSARMAISWGSSEKDTVVLSSAMAGGMAALQREIVSISGKTISPMEIELERIAGTMEEKLIIVCVLLSLDKL